MGKPWIKETEKEGKRSYGWRILLENEEGVMGIFQSSNALPFPKPWLIVGSQTVEVLDNYLDLTLVSGSFGAQLDYIIFERVECGNIEKEFGLFEKYPYAIGIGLGNYNFMAYPSSEKLSCKRGYGSNKAVLRCGGDGNWGWEGPSLECES